MSIGTEVVVLCDGDCDRRVIGVAEPSEYEDGKMTVTSVREDGWLVYDSGSRYEQHYCPEHAKDYQDSALADALPVWRPGESH